MKFYFTLFNIGIFLFPLYLNAQIPLEIDPEQIEDIRLVRSGIKAELAGEILHFDGNVMGLKNKNEIQSIRISQVRSITVKHLSLLIKDSIEYFFSQADTVISQRDPNENDFVYKIEKQTNKHIYGKFLKYKTPDFSIYIKERKPAYISLDEGIKIILQGPGIHDSPALPNRLQFLKTINGAIYKGQLIYSDQNKTLFVNEKGSLLYFPLKNIESIVFKKIVINDRYEIVSKSYPTDELYPRKFFIAPTAHMLKEGQTVYRNDLFVHNSIEYGVTDNFSVGLTASTILFAGSIGAKSKLGFEISEYIRMAVGGQYYAATSVFGGYSDFGLVYSALSVGNKKYFLNLDYGFGDGNESRAFRTWSVGGGIKIGKDLFFLGEWTIVRLKESTYQPSDKRKSLVFGLSHSYKRNQWDLGLDIFQATNDDTYLDTRIPILLSYSRFFR